MRVCTPPPHGVRAHVRRPLRTVTGRVASPGYTGPSAADAAVFHTLRASPTADLEAALSAVAAAGQLREGVLEVALQHLQAARRDSAQDVPHLEAIARQTGVALLRAAPPPPALLLGPLVEAAVGGAGDDDLKHRIRQLTTTASSTSGGMTTASALGAAAQALVAALEAQELKQMTHVAAAVEAGGSGAEAALAAAEQRQALRQQLARISNVANSMK